MGFPIVTPAILKDLKERLGAASPDEFCDVTVSVSAVEYVPQLKNIEVVRKLMEEKDILAFSMISLPDEQGAPFIAQSENILKVHPSAKYYWQIRTLFMSVLQNRSINLEKRMLLLNYSVKTIQGMIDNGQPDLIPKFIEDFTNTQDYTPVLEYFKEVRPNPGYALADGISMLKYLTKPNAAYKEVLNTIYKNIGVSGPETLKMADMKKYIGMRKAFSEMLSTEKSVWLENVMVSYVWSYSIPFNDPEFNYWEHFVFFCSLYNAVKVLLTCYMPGKEDDDFAKAVSSFDAALRASDQKLMHKVIYAVRNAGQSNNGDLATLTLS